ncbi:hypothetical protein [Amaricoccus macauensis]|uniref:hypothetical protein n=1 Tax=Amaricoccus macauensis TaxID=57001 RepID=UPI003C7B9B89
MTALVKKHLNEGETVVWSGQPSPGFWGRLKWLKIAMLAGFALAAILDSANSTRHLMFLAASAVWVVVDRFARQSIDYVLTDQRVMSVSGNGKPKWIRHADYPEPTPIVANGVQFVGIPTFTLYDLKDRDGFLAAYRGLKRAPADAPGMEETTP